MRLTRSLLALAAAATLTCVGTAAYAGPQFTVSIGGDDGTSVRPYTTKTIGSSP